MLTEIKKDIEAWWYLRRASRCARCSYSPPRRLLTQADLFYVECMGCDAAGRLGESRAAAVRLWNTTNRTGRTK